MSHIERELLLRYLSGEVSAEETTRVEAWLAEDPERWGELSRLDEERSETTLDDTAVERAGADVWARLRTDVGDAADLGELRRLRLRHASRARGLSSSSSRWTPVLQIAAGLVIAAGAGTGFAVWLRSRQPVQAPAERVAVTGAGERATLRLPDGTTVMLGVASRLRYPAAFDGGSREVSVEGEAYFDVVHDAHRPLVVRVGQMVAKDLGTQFTVRLYPEDQGARVVVREGRVAIREAGANAPERVVDAGQVGRLDHGGVPSVEPADTTQSFAWTEGRLVLDQVPLREALPQLGRWFDLEFRLADSTLGEIPLSATLKTQPTTDVLSNLAASLGLRQRKQGRTVTLYVSDSHR